jgi:hypothetical protein
MADEPQQVSWFMLQRDWEVVDESGSSLGRLTQVLGDEERDIFDGIRCRAADGSEVEVHASRVKEIDEGRVIVSGEAGSGDN